jgi:hypothetical protein
MAVSADPALGKILLVQKPNKGNIGNCVFLMVVSLPFILVVAAPTAPMEMRLGFFGFGLCLGGFAVIMLRRHWMHVFLQEFGVREYRQRRGRSLRYDQVDEMFYTSLRLFGHGSYIHTVQKLALKSNGAQGSPLVCTSIFKEADGRSPTEARTALTEVRDRVSYFLADRFSERLTREATVDWTPEVRIATRGLEIKDHHGNWELTEWRNVSRYEMKNGTLGVWFNAEAKPRVQITSAQANFYPAYALALRLQKTEVPQDWWSPG